MCKIIVSFDFSFQWRYNLYLNMYLKFSNRQKEYYETTTITPGPMTWEVIMSYNLLQTKKMLMLPDCRRFPFIVFFLFITYYCSLGFFGPTCRLVTSFVLALYVNSLNEQQTHTQKKEEIT